MRLARTIFAVSLAAVVCAGCFRLLPSRGGGQTAFREPRTINPADVALPEGYVIEVVARDLTFPTDVTFDDAGTPYVIESGYSYGERWTTPRLLRVGRGGELEEIARGGRNGPWSGVRYHDNRFYVTEGGQLEGGRVLAITRSGQVRALIENLPSRGDHHTNAPLIHNGWIYFAQGTATNSAVVGVDNAEFGWLERFPEFHDVPCRDLTLEGANFTTRNPLGQGREQVSTGAFLPFGTPSTAGQRIQGRLPCNGAVMRIRPDGSDLQLVAWGLRNPFALAAAPDGRLYVTENSFDVRGSRPVWGSGDTLWELREGTWYGWPDFHRGLPLWELSKYNPPNEPAPPRLLREHPGEPPRPAAAFAVHSSANHFDFSRSARFGFEGEAFVAQLGDMAPAVGKMLGPGGFRVVRVNPESGVINDFATNAGKTNGPASMTGRGGLERPVSAKFDPSGESLYIVDFGVMTMSEAGPNPRERTGVLWRVRRR